MNDNDRYHELDGRLSKSMLDVFVTSPVEYRERFITGKMPKPKAKKIMQLGSILHALLLEKKPASEVFKVYTSDCLKINGHRNPKPSEAFEASLPDGIIAVKQSLLPVIDAAFAAVMRSPLGDVLLEKGNVFEQRVDADLWLPSKCKPDILDTTGKRGVIYDLKFGQVSPFAFLKNIKSLRYWLQDAHYSAVCEKKFGKPFDFRWWAVETVYPFRVHPYWLCPRSREIARDVHKKAMCDLKLSIDNDDWQDRWQSEITLSEWDFGGTADCEVELEEIDGEDLTAENVGSFI